MWILFHYCFKIIIAFRHGVPNFHLLIFADEPAPWNRQNFLTRTPCCLIIHMVCWKINLVGASCVFRILCCCLKQFQSCCTIHRYAVFRWVLNVGAWLIQIECHKMSHWSNWSNITFITSKIWYANHAFLFLVSSYHPIYML